MAIIYSLPVNKIFMLIFSLKLILWNKIIHFQSGHSNGAPHQHKLDDDLIGSITTSPLIPVAINRLCCTK